MSVRIKLPAAKVVADSETNQEPTTSEPPLRRRKSAKRRLAVVSDEEYDDDTHPETALSSPHTNSPRGRSRTLEVESELEAAHATPGEIRPSNPAESTSRSRKQKFKANESGHSNKRKRLQRDSDEEYDHVVGSNDEDREAAVGNRVRSKLIKKAKPREDKPKPSVNGDTLNKDQAGASSGPPQTKMSRNILKVEGIIDAEVEGAAKPDTQSPPQNELPPVPKKRKLPTIKKNKPAAPTSTTAVPAKTPAVAVTAKIEPAKVTEVTKPPPIGARKTPASVGNADFDLRNPHVYTELFKSAGGTTPRSGLSRREKDDERRKELHKMRDEARAKRLAEMVSSFDLQMQTDKILHFEERLKSAHSSALYPNFLAAKWRELWERDKRRPKEQAWSEGRPWGESGEREEGEMSEQAAK